MSNQTKSDPKSKIRKVFEEYLKLQERLPELEAEAEDKISRAKARLMQMEPFFAMLLFKLPTMPCYTIPTMGTDGTLLLYNPVFVAEKLLRKDVVFILLHEIEHVFFKHHLRSPIQAEAVKRLFERRLENQQKGVHDQFLDHECGKIEHVLKEWNFATDYVINGHTKDNVKVPHSKYLDPDNPDGLGMKYDKKYSNWTSEKVYNEIKTPYDPDDKKCSKCGGEGCDSCEGDDPMGMGIGGILPIGLGELSEQEQKALEKELEGDVKAAAIAARKAGKLPAGVEQVIEDLYTTTTPWQDILRTVFTSMAKQDYTFLYPNKRYTMHQVEYGVVMPSLWGEEYTNVGFIMDTSGSVGQREKEILASELRNILEDYNIKLHVMYCDTKAYVDHVQVFTREDIRNGRLRLNVKGGGGTAMRPAFDWYRDNMEEHNFEVVVCMTDMYLGDWGRLGPEPPFSTYWLRLPHSSDHKPDWGQCVDIVLDTEDF